MYEIQESRTLGTSGCSYSPNRSDDSKEFLIGWGIDMHLISKLGMLEFVKKAGDEEKLVRGVLHKEAAESQLDREKVLDHIDSWLGKQGGRTGYAASVMSRESGHSFEALGTHIVGLVFEEGRGFCRGAVEEAASRYFPIDMPGSVPVYVRGSRLYTRTEAEKDSGKDARSRNRSYTISTTYPPGMTGIISGSRSAGMASGQTDI